MQRRAYNDTWTRGSSRGNKKWQPAQKEARKIPEALGPEVRSISLKDIGTSDFDGLAEITDCEYTASYNLMEGLSKKILVPGRPPLWTPLPHDIRLQPDSGDYYRDENGARFPDHPLEPVVLSVFRMNPDFDPSSIDIVACGGTLGNLLRFSRGRGEPFSFAVQLIGKTTFYIRRELTPTELIQGVYGFGHAFLEANTSWSPDMKGSSSHQRVVTYTLGGKNILVRFEADGYTMDQADDFAEGDADGGAPLEPTAVEDALSGLMRPRAAVLKSDAAIVSEKGSRTAPESVIDIKTRSVQKLRHDILADEVPRLWLRQVNNLVLAFHNKGFFKPAAIDDMTSAIFEWEKDNKEAIARLAGLIDQIGKAVVAARGGKLEVRCIGADSLQFHELSSAEQDKWNALPEDLRKQWTRR